MRRALDQHEKILIYGDYDVDGTMAVVVLLTALRMLGGEVEAYVPHRLTDGYGMRVPVVEEAAANGFRVVISVDTGIREHAVLERARELGVDCIVTDHHLPDGHLPPACAILNPRRADCGYPEKSLAGVGVAFKLAQALLGDRMTARLLQSFLKVVAIGTIADVVPLLGENRVIARFGLEALRQPAQSGLAALIELSGLAGKEISAGDVGFRLAPRLNAAGRMENARDVIDLFTLPDAARTREIAERLERLEPRAAAGGGGNPARDCCANGAARRPQRAIHFGAGRRGMAPRRDRHCGAASGGAVSSSGAGDWNRGWGRRGFGAFHQVLSPAGCAYLGGRSLPALWRACAGGGLRPGGGAAFRNSRGALRSTRAASSRPRTWSRCCEWTRR